MSKVKSISLLKFSLVFSHPREHWWRLRPSTLHRADGLGLVHMVLWLVLLVSLLSPASFHILSCLAFSLPVGPDVFVQSFLQRRSEALTQIKSWSRGQVELWDVRTSGDRELGAGGWADGDREWKSEKKTYTRETGLGNTLTSSWCAHGRRKKTKNACINCVFPTCLLLFFSVCLSVPRLVGRVGENINRMQSCLIVNPLSSAPWLQALDHVRSPPALATPTPAQTTPPLLAQKMKPRDSVCASVWCVHMCTGNGCVFPNSSWKRVCGQVL